MDKIKKHFVDCVVSKEYDGWHCISTPFLGAFNDHIEVWICIKGEEYILQDDKAALWTMENKGYSKEDWEGYINEYGKSWFKGLCGKDEEIEVRTDLEGFSHTYHSFIALLIIMNNLPNKGGK